MMQIEAYVFIRFIVFANWRGLNQNKLSILAMPHRIEFYQFQWQISQRQSRVLNLIDQESLYKLIELKIIMNLQQDLANKKTSTLCPDCSAFYGTQATNNLCSSCYKKKASSKKEEIIEKSPALTSTPLSVAEKELVQAMQQLKLEGQKREQKDKKRCFDCSKKVGLLGIECKCGFVYCNGHRLPENHNCQFDHKQSGKEKLKRDVVKVCNGKIKDI